MPLIPKYEYNSWSDSKMNKIAPKGVVKEEFSKRKKNFLL